MARNRVGIAFTGGVNSFTAYIYAKLGGHNPIPFNVYYRDEQRGELKLHELIDDQISDLDLQEFNMGNVWIDHPLKDTHPYPYMVSPVSLMVGHYSLGEIWIGTNNQYLQAIPYVVSSPTHDWTNADKLKYIQEYLGIDTMKRWLDIQLDEYSLIYEWVNITEQELEQWRRSL